MDTWQPVPINVVTKAPALINLSTVYIELYHVSVHVMYTCCTHAVHMLYTCFRHAIMLFNQTAVKTLGCTQTL